MKADKRIPQKITKKKHMQYGWTGSLKLFGVGGGREWGVWACDFSYVSFCGPSSCASFCWSSCGGWWEQLVGWGRAACCYPGCWSLRWLWRKGRSHHSPELKGNIALHVSKDWFSKSEQHGRDRLFTSTWAAAGYTLGTCNKRDMR